jgi:hypothetical protein
VTIDGTYGGTDSTPSQGQKRNPCSPVRLNRSDTESSTSRRANEETSLRPLACASTDPKFNPSNPVTREDEPLSFHRHDNFFIRRHCQIPGYHASRFVHDSYDSARAEGDNIRPSLLTCRLGACQQ